jgi:hypothetical protein
MSLSRLQQRLSRLEKGRSRKTCTCPPKERYDFNLLTAEERSRLVGIAERSEPEDPDPCPCCGRGRAPCRYDDLKDSELEDTFTLLFRATVENGPHEFSDLFEMDEPE